MFEEAFLAVAGIVANELFNVRDELSVVGVLISGRAKTASGASKRMITAMR